MSTRDPFNDLRTCDELFERPGSNHETKDNVLNYTSAAASPPCVVKALFSSCATPRISNWCSSRKPVKYPKLRSQKHTNDAHETTTASPSRTQLLSSHQPCIYTQSTLHPQSSLNASPSSTFPTLQISLSSSTSSLLSPSPPAPPSASLRSLACPASLKATRLK